MDAGSSRPDLVKPLSCPHEVEAFPGDGCGHSISDLVMPSAVLQHPSPRQPSLSMSVSLAFENVESRFPWKCSRAYVCCLCDKQTPGACRGWCLTALSHSIAGLVMPSDTCSRLGIFAHEKQRHGTCMLLLLVSQGLQSLRPISDLVMPLAAGSRLGGSSGNLVARRLHVRSACACPYPSCCCGKFDWDA